MLNTYITNQNDTIVGYDVDGNAQYATEMKKHYKEGLEAIEQGEGKTLSEIITKYNNE